MKYVLGAVLLIALVVWIVHNIRAIIRLRKAKKEGILKQLPEAKKR